MLLYVRTVVIGIWFFLCSLVCLAVAVFRPLDWRNGQLFCRIIRILTEPLLGLKIELRHPERKEVHQPCIYIGNHQNSIDLFTYGRHYPCRTVTIGKKSVKYIPLFGWLYWLSGHILLDRFNHDRAVETLRHAVDYLRKNNLSVIIMPEGTRSRGKGLGPFKKGAFHLAVELQWPLVPFVTCSLSRSTDFNRWNAGHIVMDVLEPIPTKGKGLQDVEQLLQTAHTQMKDAIAKLDASVMPLL